MSPEEELQKIMSLLDDVGIERGDNLGSYTALFRVELLSRIASQQSFAPDAEAVCVCGDELFAVNPDGKCAWCKLPRR